MSILHINRARGHYIGQVRKEGHRLWNTVTIEYKLADDALLALATMMKDMKRGRVLFIDASGYYEPNLVLEINRK